jgi:putative ABC transport system permease protein
MAWFPVHAPRPKLEYTGTTAIVFVFAFAVTILAGVAFGLAPALQLSRDRISDALKTRRFRLRGFLIVSETALSLILLAGAGLMIRSFLHLMEVEPGFRPENVLTIQVPMPSFLSGITSFASRKEVETHQAFEYRDLIDRCRTLPGVAAAAIGTVLPLSQMEVHTQAGFEGDPNPQQDHGAQLRSVSPDYFRAMGIPLLDGRSFADSDAGSAPEVAIVNDSLARKYWPHDSAVGKHVNMSGLPQGPWYEVVGVVGSIRHRQLSDSPEPEIYRPYLQYLGPAFGTVLIVRATRDPRTLAPSIRSAIRTQYPNQPIGEIKLMTAVVADSVSAPRFYTSLLAAFAALALALGFAGIYGVMSYSVAQRTREVGIRMALGATRPAVIKLVLAEGLLQVAIGILAGIAGASALTRLIASQLYSTKPSDPITYAAVSLLMMMVALAAAIVPASRASRVDPMIALRED